jgi:hypothetical protein
MRNHPIILWALSSLFLVGCLLYVGASGGTRALTATAAAHATVIPPGWTLQTVAHQVTFALPADFVPNGDGTPGFTLVGGGILNHSHTQFELLLGVAVLSGPGANVEAEATALQNMYHADTLMVNTTTAYGRELAWQMGDSRYTVYLAPLAKCVRIIIINNEHNRARYAPEILTFLNSVTDTGSAA